MSDTPNCKTLPNKPLLKIDGLPFKHIGSGKVREIFDLDDRLLIIATDRISAFDVILPNGIPGKGLILTQISLWWFAQTESIIRNHLVENHESALRKVLSDRPELIPYSMLVRKLKPLPLEAVVRGYIVGGGWNEYQKTGELWGHQLPEGLQQYQKLPTTLFTPSTKAELGHDESISEAQAKKLLGHDLFNQIKKTSIQIFNYGTEQAKRCGLMLADTKFEFGQDENGQLFLIDEVLTPDSSRYWPASSYELGKRQEGFDKQFVRDYLEGLDWEKTYPGPQLSAEIVNKTQTLYKQAWERLTS